MIRVRDALRHPRFRGLAESVGFGFVGKGIGFLVPIVIAASFGVTAQTDALFLAYAIIAALVQVWGAMIEQFSVPLLAEVQGRDAARARVGWIRRRAFTGAFASWCLAGIGLGLYLWWKPGSLPRRETIGYFLALGPQLWLAALAAPDASFLVSRGEYRWSSLSSGLRAIGVLVMVAVFPRSTGAMAVAAGYSAGELLRAIVVHVMARRRCDAEGATGSTISAPAPGTVARGAQQLASMALVGINPVLDRSIAATFVAGAVSRLDYATKLFYVPSLLFDMNVTGVFLSEWSREVAEGRWEQLRADVRKTVQRVFLLATVIALGVVALRMPLVRLVLARGHFPLGEVGPVASLLAVFMVAFPFASAGVLLGGAYVAMGENLLLLRISAAKVAFRAAAALLLSRPFGVTGLAAAFVATHVLECVLCLASLDRVVRRRAQAAARSGAVPQELVGA